MNDNLPPLPAPEAWRTRVGPWGDRSTDYAFTPNQMREYAAQAVADRDVEIVAEQRRSEMYADLVRRTAEALGLTREDGWHKLPERVAVLCEANERFGQRQEWWTEKMFELEQERDALKAEVKALREANDTFARNSILPDHLCIMERAEVEALRADADKHYAAGWIAAAKWAERDDLISDIDSPAYIADRDAAIDRARSKE